MIKDYEKNTDRHGIYKKLTPLIMYKSLQEVEENHAPHKTIHDIHSHHHIHETITISFTRSLILCSLHTIASQTLGIAGSTSRPRSLEKKTTLSSSTLDGEAYTTKVKINHSKKKTMETKLTYDTSLR